MADDVLAPKAVVLRTTTTADVAFALGGLLLGPVELWGSVFMPWSPDFSSHMQDIRGGAILAMVRDAIGPAPLAVGFGLLGFWLLCTGIGGAWRLIDRRPALSADDEGLQFHPSIGPRRISWREIAGITASHGMAGQIRIDLTRRIWSTLVWASGRSIRINNRALFLSASEAERSVKAMKALAPEHFGRNGQVRRRNIPE